MAKLTFEQILANPAVIEQYLATDLTSSTTYICGSLAEGFGNSRSDLDIYVIADSWPETLNAEGRVLYEGSAKIHNILVGESRIDIEYWTWNDVKRMQKILRNYEGNGDKLRLKEDEIDFLHRLKFAKPLQNVERFHELIDNTDFDQFDRGMIVAHINIYQGLVEDLQGCLECDDNYTALTASRLLLDRAVDAYLASFGETNPRPKWRMRKLLRAFGKDNPFFQNYMKLQYVSDLSQDSILQHVESVLLFSQWIVVQAQRKLEVPKGAV